MLAVIRAFSKFLIVVPSNRAYRSQIFLEQNKTNVLGVLDVTNAVLPYMRERKSGTIALIGSRSAWRPEIPVSSF